MAEKFNLLPKKENRQATKTDKALKSTAIALFAISLIVLASLSGGLFFFSRRLTNINAEIKKNKTEISSLETAESGLVVAKDRAQKISSILELRRNEQIFGKYLKVISSLPDSIELKDITLDDTETSMALIGTNSKDFSGFIDWLMINGDDFNVIYANDVGLAAERGYNISMEVK